MSKKIARKKVDEFLKAHATDKKVLDIGSGASSYSYSDLFPDRICVDIDPQRKPDIIADVYDLPFENDEFEVILCTEVLEHLADPPKAIKEMQRVLKPGGKLILTTRFAYPLHDVPGDYFRYTKYGLRFLFKDWHIEILEDEMDSFATVAALLQRMILQSKYKFNKVAKLFIRSLTIVLPLFDRLITKQFGDIKQTKKEINILTTGYHLVAYKK